MGDNPVNGIGAKPFVVEFFCRASCSDVLRAKPHFVTNAVSWGFAPMNIVNVMSRARGYPTCRLGLAVPESRSVWTEASAHALCWPSVAVQVFQVVCRYMHSPRVVGKSWSRRYHGNNLPDMHKSRARRIEGRVTSVAWKISRVQKT